MKTQSILEVAAAEKADAILLREVIIEIRNRTEEELACLAFPKIVETDKDIDSSAIMVVARSLVLKESEDRIRELKQAHYARHTRKLYRVDANDLETYEFDSI